MVIFGQDPAIDTLASAIKMARSGLGDPAKPIGSFLFAGPTGVGKTEVTRQLAMQLGIELVRFDMSEYMEAHSVSRLIGAPPGRSEEHTSELQSLMRISYAVFFLKKKKYRTKSDEEH